MLDIEGTKAPKSETPTTQTTTETNQNGSIGNFGFSFGFLTLSFVVLLMLVIEFSIILRFDKVFKSFNVSRSLLFYLRATMSRDAVATMINISTQNKQQTEYSSERSSGLDGSSTLTA
jgi:hypothetical protein